MKTFLSLRRAIVTGIALGVILPAVVALPLLMRDAYRRETDERVRDMLAQYAAMLAQGIAIPMWQADAEAAKPFARSVLLNPDVAGILVEDASLGEFIALKQAVPESGQRFHESHLVAHEGATIGKVTVEMTTAGVERQLLRDFAKAAGLVALQIGVSMVLLFLLFERRINRPLRRLHDDVIRLGLGQLDEPVHVASADELGNLALGIDRMRQSLNDKIAETQELNATLERRVGERTQALHETNSELTQAMEQLQSAKEEIERSDRMAALGALVAGVAHELNTPIGNSVTVASTLHDLCGQFRDTMDEGLTRRLLKEYVDSTQQAADLLMRNLNNAAELIGSFKQVAVDRTTAPRRKFLLDEVVGETVRTLSPVLRPRQHEARVNIPGGITMDSYPGQLGQVLSNLVNNAVLHGFEGRTQCEIVVSARKLSEERVELCIADNGCGVPEANLRRIFDPFFTTKMGRGGTGLGLNIVHNLVTDVLGGTIRVDSQEARGTRFWLVLPCRAPGVDGDAAGL